MPEDNLELSPAETSVLRALDERRLVQTLVELVQVPSVTGSDAESELQLTLAERLGRLGMEVDCWELDLAELAADPEHPGTEVERERGVGLVAGLPGRSGAETPELVLQAHVDVVPTGALSEWAVDPFGASIRGDVLHGRGACDMKAGLAANLAVADALVRSGVQLEHPFALHCVPSEEDGGLGAFATLRRGHSGRAAVIPEPTDGQLLTACAGSVTFRLEVPGRAAHGSARLSGVSALDNFWHLDRALVELERRRNLDPDPLFAGEPLPYALSIGHVHTGDWASTVPNLLVAEGRLGVRLDETPEQARAELAAAVAQACRDHPFLAENPAQLSWPGGTFAAHRMTDDHELIDQVRRAARATSGNDPTPGAAPYGSDLRLYAGLGGIPTLHFGPGQVTMAHAPREQVSISQTIEVARALAVLAVRRLGAHH